MSNTLPIPLVALEDCGAILGRRGAGKSATKTLFFERELDAGRRCCLIDPKGDGWGIRLNPDGTPSRFQSVPIFGGDHGDIALTEEMGSTLGNPRGSLKTLSLVEYPQPGSVRAADWLFPERSA